MSKYISRIISPAIGLLPPATDPSIYPSAVAHFSSIPWCAALLNSQDGATTTTTTVPFIASCRNPASEKHDQLLGASLAHPRALAHILSFFHAEDASHAHDPSRPVNRVSTLFALGEGLSGVEDTLHGGMTMAMMDEATGIVHDLNMALGKTDRMFRAVSMTAGMEVRFSRPIPVGTAVCATAWVEGVDGRKSTMRCVVRDGEGVELASCSSLWISVRTKL